MSKTQAQRLIPVDDDHDTGGFFEAARRGELALRRCNGCDALLHVPRMYCRHCGSWEGRWEIIDGAATLFSYSVVHHQVHPAYPTPYTVVLVELDALPEANLVGSIAGIPALEIGMAMEPWFDHVGDIDDRQVLLPNWRPASG